MSQGWNGLNLFQLFQMGEISLIDKVTNLHARLQNKLNLYLKFQLYIRLSSGL